MSLSMYRSGCETTKGSENHKYLVEILETGNKQLLDEVEHDIVNYQNRGL